MQIKEAHIKPLDFVMPFMAERKKLFITFYELVGIRSEIYLAKLI